MQVVQNRTYSKEKRFELGLYGGFDSADPFLSIKTVGLSLGYHFTEYFGVQALWWKYFVTNSSAANDFISSQNNAYPDTNEPKEYYGGEFLFSPIYGKLSLMGAAIIHYDFHLMAGTGILKSESGSNLAFDLGLGQQVYLSNHFALNLDYRIMRNNETVLHKSPTNAGQPAFNRVNYSSVFTVGVSVLM